jgi:hypothetical protein
MPTNYLCAGLMWKANSTFRVWAWKFISNLKTQCETGKSKSETQKQTPCIIQRCHYNFVHSFVTERFVRCVNDIVSHFLVFNTSSYLIDFTFFTRQNQLRNSTTNGRSSSNILIRCKQSVPTCRLLFRTSLWIATITGSAILQNFGRLAKLIGWSCLQNNQL